MINLPRFVLYEVVLEKATSRYIVGNGEALLSAKIEGLKRQKPVGSIKARPKLREWFQSTKTLGFTTLDNTRKDTVY